MADERRDYDKNGKGRRDYDDHACPFFDWDKHKCSEVEAVKEKVDSKLSINMFKVFVASAGTFLIFLTGALITMSWKSLDKIDLVQEAVVEIKVESAVIAVRQKALMKQIRRGKRRNVRKSSLDRPGDNRPELTEPRDNPVGRFSGD